MAEIDSFEDARRLSDDELRRLLETGRPEERVWAIWALALRASSDADSIGALGERPEPDPGVRRNLAVVLAGHGQLDLLVALSRRDPAPEVRAAAIQLVTRIAIDGKLSPALVTERIAVDGSAVKLAVLGTIFAGAPRWLLDLAPPLLEDRDADVRYEAFEALARAGSLDHALMWLEEAPESEARLAIMRWSARGRVRPCAEALATASRRLRRLLVESVRTATWDDLSPAIGDEPMLIRALARRVHNVFDHMPLVTLLRATLREPSDAWIVMVRDRLTALPSPEPEISIQLPDYLELCARRIAEIDLLVRELQSRAPRSDHPDVQTDLEQLDDQRVALESALDQASRMIVH